MQYGQYVNLCCDIFHIYLYFFHRIIKPSTSVHGSKIREIRDEGAF